MADSPRIEELRRRVQMDPASIAFAALAEEYRRAGRYDEAIATCHAGLKRHPAYLSARVTLGRSLVELGRYDAAQEQLEYVLKAAPENLAATRGLAEIRSRRSSIPASAAAPGHPEMATGLPQSEPPQSAPQTTPARQEPPPLRAVRLSPVKVTGATEPSGARGVSPTTDFTPPPPAGIAVPDHPDKSSLPALESFLTAIVRAREAKAAGSSGEH